MRREITTGLRMKSLPPAASPILTSSGVLREVRKAIGTWLSDDSERRRRHVS